MTTAAFVDAWRRRACRAYDLERNSTARRTVEFDLWGRPVRAYANANLSVYSAQPCDRRCPFCVEQLRPAARGRDLADQRAVEADDRRYFAALGGTLRALRPLDPSVSVTGGEPTKDPRLPRILRTLRDAGARKRTLTTNGSGLLDRAEGREILDWILDTGVRHLNISRAHPDPARNCGIMSPPEDATEDRLPEIARRARAGGTRVRLSCVLLRGAVDSLEGILRYLDFAAATGVDNVVFRQLMLTDGRACGPHPVARYSDDHRVRLFPLLDRISADPRFAFVKQVLGYYYYVEVWRFAGIDVVFEEADLGRLEETKRLWPGLIHELVFHPDARLASTWQPWDGVLGPPEGRGSVPARMSIGNVRATTEGRPSSVAAEGRGTVPARTPIGDARATTVGRPSSVAAEGRGTVPARTPISDARATTVGRPSSASFAFTQRR